MGTLRDRQRNHEAFANIWDPTFMMAFLKNFKRLYGIEAAKQCRWQMRQHGWMDCQVLESHPLLSNEAKIAALAAGIEGVAVVFREFSQSEDGCPEAVN